MLDIRTQLMELTVSILSDVLGGQGVLEPGLLRISGIGTVAGRAVTADCREGSLQPVFQALEQAAPSDFLCIRGPGTTAYLGDLLATNIVNRGLSGAIVDGFARDRAALVSMPATFVARGLTPINLRRQEPGEAMRSLAISGVTIEPGDWLVVDDDGVIAIKPEQVQSAIHKAVHTMKVEQRIKELVLQLVPVPDAVRQALAEVGP